MNIFNHARNTHTYKPESLKKTQVAVNKKSYLPTEDFFKALLSYYKPEQSQRLPLATRTPRDPVFLDTLIQK